MKIKHSYIFVGLLLSSVITLALADYKMDLPTITTTINSTTIGGGGGNTSAEIEAVIGGNASYAWYDNTTIFASGTDTANSSEEIEAVIASNESYRWWANTSIFNTNNGSYVPYTGADTNIDLGIYNITTTGFGQFQWIDKLENLTTIDTPPANTLRLHVEDIHGFSFYKFIDDTGMKRELVRDSMILVRNIRGSTIAANRIVYATGNSNGVSTVDLAKADSATTMPAIGVTIESITNGSYGRLIQVGLIENVDTSGFNEGDILYVSSATEGIPMTALPTPPNLIQEIGTILVSDATAGSIQIVARGVDGNEYGTAQDSFLIGDATAGNKTLVFNDGSQHNFTWDNANDLYYLDNDLIVAGNVTADYFIGDGRELTNIQTYNATYDSNIDTANSSEEIEAVIGGNVSYAWYDNSTIFESAVDTANTTEEMHTAIANNTYVQTNGSTVTGNISFNTGNASFGSNNAFIYWNGTNLVIEG